MSQKRTTEFIIIGQPVSCPRPRVTRHGTFYPKKYKEAKKLYAGQIRLHFAHNNLDQFIGPVALHVAFIHRRPKAMKGVDRVWKTTRPDVDNLVKTIKDAISAAGAWKDDSQCCVLYAIDNYAEPNEEPHTRIIMTELSEAPRGSRCSDN